MGQRRRQTRTVSSKREAEALRSKLLTETEGGGSTQRTVADLARRWIDNNSGRWAPRQDELARGHVRLHIGPELGRIRLDRLGTADVDRLYRALEKKVVRTNASGKPVK